MAINILTNYNFNGNQIINTVVDSRLRSTITNPRPGQLAFDTDSKRLYYYKDAGTGWVGADANDAIDHQNGNDIIGYINGVATTARINNDRLANNSITIGTTTFSLGETKTNITGLTINDVEFSKLATGFTIEGGTTKKKITINDAFTTDTNSLTLGSGKIFTGYANLTAGDAINNGDITIKSNSATARVLTLTNASLELAGTGTKLTVNGTPTIAGGGSITIPTSSPITIQSDNGTARTLTLGGNVILNGTTSATLNAPLTVGTPTSNAGAVTLRSNGAAETIITSTGTVNLVAGTMVNTADAQLHMQNTDIGTSSTVFQVNSAGGVKLKSVNMSTENLELVLRNEADNAYASLRVNNLYVEGTTTTINSNEVNIGDSEVLLNSDITLAAENQDGGISIKRFDGILEHPAKITFIESVGKWQTTNINAGNAVNKWLTNKFVATFGDGVLTNFTITHNLNTRDLAVTIRETAGDYGLVYADIDFSDLNAIGINVSTTSVPATNQYTVTIVG